MKLVLEVYDEHANLESVYTTNLFNSKRKLLADWEEKISFHKTHALPGQELEFPFYMRKFKVTSQIQVYELSEWFENSKVEKI